MGEALKQAGSVAKALQSAGMSRNIKAGFFDIVTEGDIASQKIIIQKLSEIFPGIPFAAEESDSEAQVAGVELAAIDADTLLLGTDTYIAVDPVDGTSNYACGGPDWGVTAAVIQGGQPLYGAIYLPAKDILVTAARGHGCYLNGSPIRLRQSQTLRESLVAAEMGAFIPDDRLHRLIPLVHHCLGIRNLFSSTGNTVDLLQGIQGAWVHLKGGSVWDFAAGALAVTEAGGFACDLQGAPLTWHKLKMEVILAVNEPLGRQVVDVLGFPAAVAPSPAAS